MREELDLAVAWNWELDAQFIGLLEQACRELGVSLIQITPGSLARVLGRLAAGELSVRVLLDRASDADPGSGRINERCRASGARIVNDAALAHRAWDKATMHLEFISAGLHTPWTHLLPPFAAAPDLDPVDLTLLGDRFILKPANGGGGIGVVRGLTTWEEIQRAREKLPAEKHLLQAWVTPSQTEHGPAWFRVLYALGEVLPFWWHVQTHVYRQVTDLEVEQLGLSELREIALTIARITGLDIFSTEVARRECDGLFVSVDYVNDPIDLRPQSTAADGVPDAAVRTIAARIASLALALR